MYTFSYTFIYNIYIYIYRHIYTYIYFLLFTGSQLPRGSSSSSSSSNSSSSSSSRLDRVPLHLRFLLDFRQEIIHPAVLRVGIQMGQKKICGTNARTAAMLKGLSSFLILYSFFFVLFFCLFCLFCLLFYFCLLIGIVCVSLLLFTVIIILL